MVKCMKFFDRISETLGLYEEEDDELLELSLIHISEPTRP